MDEKEEKSKMKYINSVWNAIKANNKWHYWRLPSYAIEMIRRERGTVNDMQWQRH